jgi:hypothetical protein
MAVELAERRGIALADARELLAAVDLTRPAPSAPEPVAAPEQPSPQAEAAAEEPQEEPAVEFDPVAEANAPAAVGAAEPAAEPESAAAQPAVEDGPQDAGYEEQPEIASPSAPDADVWAVLENGIREISGEVRNSLDFHRSQDGGGEVSHVVLSGAAEEIPGFAGALELALGVAVRPEAVGVVDQHGPEHAFRHRLAVAAGLAAAEAPQ